MNGGAILSTILIFTGGELKQKATALKGLKLLFKPTLSTMKLPTERYTTQQEHLPAKGQQIIAQFDSQSIIVYQAFQDAIADYAVANQSFERRSGFQRTATSIFFYRYEM